MNRTPLYETHRALKAKLVDFVGWEMPIQYSGVVDEYQAVRTKAGLFDVSHMGRLSVTGSGSVAFLQQVTTNDVAKFSVGQAHYSLICNEQGGIKDDIFIYRLNQNDFLVCVNASNRAKIVAWFQEQTKRTQDCTVRDQSTEMAQIALQGPASRDIISRIADSSIGSLKLRHCVETTLLGKPGVVARTGYTGEFGYEFYVPVDRAVPLWNELMKVGYPLGLKPAGLGSRDLLRLEMAYLLYGNDIDEDTTPLEAGVEWAVSFQKGPFVGRDALVKQQETGLKRRFISFELLEKAVPRHGFNILSGGDNREPLGEVSSGNLSPMLQKGIGLGYVPPTHAAPGTSIMIDIRGKLLPALVIKPPFYKKPRANG